MSQDFMIDEAKDLALSMLRGEVAKLQSQLEGCKSEIFDRIISEHHALAKVERLEELYKSACGISESRRLEIVLLSSLLKEIEEHPELGAKQAAIAARRNTPTTQPEEHQ